MMTTLLLLAALQDLRLGDAKANLRSGGAAFSPYGTWLAWAVESEVRFCDAATGKVTRVLDHGKSRVDRVQVGSLQHVLALTADGEIWFWDPEGTLSWKSRPPTTAIVNKFTDVLLMPRGILCLARSHLGDVYVGRDKTWMELAPDEPTALAIHPDDLSRFALAFGDGKVRTVKGKTEGVDLGAADKPARALAFSPSGAALAAGTAEGKIFAWNIADRKVLLDGSSVHPDSVRALLWTSVGLVTGGGDGAARLWDVESGKEKKSFKGHAAPIRSLSLSADGKRLLSASEDGTAAIWAFP